MKLTKREMKLNLSSFDLLKGGLIFLVLVGHIFDDISYDINPILEEIRNKFVLLGFGGMPAFLMICGHRFKEKDPKKLLKSTFSSLVIPCAWVSLFILLITPVTRYLFVYETWEETVYETICQVLGFLLGLSGPERVIRVFGYELVSCGPIWFFWALFTAQNVFNQILLRLKKSWQQLAAVLLCMAVGYLLSNPRFLFYCIPQGLVSVGFLYAGYLMKKYKVLQWMVYDIRAYLMLILIALAEMKWGCFHMWNLDFNNVVLDILGASCMGLLMILVGLWFGQFEWKILEPVKELGIYSFWFLAVHNVEMYVIPWEVFGPLLGWHPALYLLLLIPLRLVIVLTGVSVLKKISKYNYNRKALKKKKASAR